MKFMITRTRTRDRIKPCEGAVREKYDRVVDGQITRDFDEAWFIEFPSLEDLMKFQESVKEKIIMSHSIINDEICEIEIYDDYRE